MDTESQHLIVDIVLENEITPLDLKTIKEKVRKDFNVLKEMEHQFTPHGETAVFILSESHFSIHTYPEHNYLSMDLYICNPDANLEKFIFDLKNELKVKLISHQILRRGTITKEESALKLKLLYLVTVFVAMASILYEMLLAQSLSTVMGNTALRYNVTIGIYIAAMGFGALFYKKIISGGRLINSFLKVELLLSFIGGISPALVLIIDYLANKFSGFAGIHFYHPIIQIPIFTINHILIFLIGFVSGLELPLLIDIAKKLSSSKNNHVLAFDYFGTLIGAIIFPLILLPSFSLFGLGFTISFLNILVAVIVSIKLKDVDTKWIFLALIGLIISVLLIFYSNSISDYLINTFYFAGKFK